MQRGAKSYWVCVLTAFIATTAWAGQGNDEGALETLCPSTDAQCAAIRDIRAPEPQAAPSRRPARPAAPAPVVARAPSLPAPVYQVTPPVSTSNATVERPANGSPEYSFNGDSVSGEISEGAASAPGRCDSVELYLPGGAHRDRLALSASSFDGRAFSFSFLNHTPDRVSCEVKLDFTLADGSSGRHSATLRGIRELGDSTYRVELVLGNQRFLGKAGSMRIACMNCDRRTGSLVDPEVIGRHMMQQPGSSALNRISTRVGASLFSGSAMSVPGVRSGAGSGTAR